MHNDLLVDIDERVFKERNRDWGMRDSIMSQSSNPVDIRSTVVVFKYVSCKYTNSDKMRLSARDADSADHMISTTTPESASTAASAISFWSGELINAEFLLLLPSVPDTFAPLDSYSSPSKPPPLFLVNLGSDCWFFY